MMIIETKREYMIFLIVKGVEYILLEVLAKSLFKSN